MRLTIIIVKGILHIYSFISSIFNKARFKRSRNIEGNFKYMNLSEKLWWAYKALIFQIERAEKGKGIEDYFKGQNLIFSEDEELEKKGELTITAGGDLSCSEAITPESVKYLWDDVQDFYFSGDIVCANLESPVDTTKPVSVVPSVCLTAPDLNTSPELFKNYVGDGNRINFFSTANNHSLDMGEEGVINTIEFLDRMGFPHVGTSKSINEQSNIPVIVKNNIKVAFISYTFSLNGKEEVKDKEYLVNVIRLNKPDSDISLIKEHVKIAKDKGADVIVAMLHWSIEFETYPIQNVITMGHRIMKCGVDIILGGHPHVAQPMEKYSFVDPYTNEEKTGFIVYSLGELVSYNAFSNNSRLAWLIKLNIKKYKLNDSYTTRITGVTLSPIYTLVRKNKNGTWEYRLLDFVHTLKLIKKGATPFNLGSKTIREFYRLEKLLYDKLLPNKFDLYKE